MPLPTATPAPLAIGCRVAGHYYDRPFTGVLVSFDCSGVCIDFDAPMDYYGDGRSMRPGCYLYNGEGALRVIEAAPESTVARSEHGFTYLSSTEAGQ